MKKLILFLMMCSSVAMAEDSIMTVETAFKKGSTFDKKDAQYYMIQYYTKGVLNGYHQSKFNIVANAAQRQSINYAIYNNNFQDPETLMKQILFYETEEYKQNFENCILAQDPDFVMKRVFYKYIDGKIDGKSDFSKEIIETSEVYCKEKLNQIKII